MIKNPIIRGFCPDPSIIKANGLYYIATSTFEWWPGVKLFESSDLKNFRQIASPLKRRSQLDLTGVPPSAGVWAPCLSYDGRLFYLIYTDVKTKKGRYYNTNNYAVWTDDIYGGWSEPVYLNSIGFDPSLFHDDDGKKYLVNMINGFKGITVQELDKRTLRPVGERVTVYKGSGIGCTEGPHIYHIGDYYYLIVAEGGTGYDHCVTMARADSVYGPYITAPNNPLYTSDRKQGLQKCGHGDIIQADNKRWYLLHLCARPGRDGSGCLLGRETAIQEIELSEDGFFEPKGDSPYCLEEIEDAEGLPEYEKGDGLNVYDRFEEETIDVRYSSFRWDYAEFAHIDTDRHELVIRGEESLNSLFHVSLLAVRQKEHACRTETVMNFEPEAAEHFAGLAYVYDNLNWYIFGKTLNEEGIPVLVIIKSDRGTITDLITPVEIRQKGVITLRIETDGYVIRFGFCTDERFVKIDAEQTTAILTDEYCRGFTGAHFGMYVHDMLD
ncbi:MAG: glycoside hydrolase family 43 protein, partial [Lachnospiraceae bacterium]|nr:glycoside hydrolase family 43 protein [Lachnospiraceae bacterium]